VFSVVGYFYVDPVLTWLAKPVGRFIFTSPTDALFVRLKISCILGLLISFPIILFQLWRFVEVALFNRERTFVNFVLPTSCVLFYGGMLLAIYGVAPLAVRFLLKFSSPELMPFISIQSYLSILLWMILGFGLFFQMPIVVVALCQSGIVQPKTLSQYRKHILVGLLIVAAFMTPGPDIFSQLILTVPSYLLFELSLFMAHRFQK